MLLTTHEDIIKFIKKLNNKITDEYLNQYWDNFKTSSIALYNENEVFLIKHSNPPENFTNENGIFIGKLDNKFLGNTCIELNGEYTAIWDISKKWGATQEEELLCAIIHELFHAYQYKNGDERFGNEMIFIKYPFTKENIALRVNERNYLLKAVFEKNLDMKKEFIQKFIQCREARRKIIGYFLNYELGNESMEGTAYYVEHMVFTNESHIPKEYVISLYGEDLLGYPNNLIHFRRSCYSSGLFICLLLDHLNPNWKSEYIKSNLYLYDFLVQTSDFKKHFLEKININDYSCAEYLIKKNEEYKEKSLEDFNDSEGFKIVFRGNFALAGFDPMNILCKDEHILHKHFLKFKIESQEICIKDSVLTKHGEEIWDIKEITLFSKVAPIIKDNLIMIQNCDAFHSNLLKENNCFYIDF